MPLPINNLVQHAQQKTVHIVHNITPSHASTLLPDTIARGYRIVSTLFKYLILMIVSTQAPAHTTKVIIGINKNIFPVKLKQQKNNAKNSFFVMYFMERANFTKISS